MEHEIETDSHSERLLGRSEERTILGLVCLGPQWMNETEYLMKIVD